MTKTNMLIAGLVVLVIVLAAAVALLFIRANNQPTTADSMTSSSSSSTQVDTSDVNSVSNDIDKQLSSIDGNLDFADFGTIQ